MAKPDAFLLSRFAALGAEPRLQIVRLFLSAQAQLRPGEVVLDLGPAVASTFCSPPTAFLPAARRLRPEHD